MPKSVLSVTLSQGIGLVVLLAVVVYLGLVNHKEETQARYQRPLQMMKKDTSCSVVPIPYDAKFNDDPCLEKPNQDAIGSVLAFASRPTNQIAKLQGPCEEREYTWATLDEERLRIMNLYTKMAIAELNARAVQYAKNIAKVCPYSPTGEPRTLRPFFFKFIQVINATSSVDKHGNSRWRVDVMIEEMSLHLSLRLMLDFTIHVYPPAPGVKGDNIATCAEYTTFPFPRYFQGYPALQGAQMIPLPSQVIVSSREVLSQGGQDSNWPRFKNLFLNRVWMENSDLALGTELPSTLDCHTAAAVNDTTLPSSAYPKRRLLRKDVKFPEKEYADCLEATGKAIDTDIHNNYTLKPCGYNCTGVPENGYHFQGSTESFKQSMAPPTYPNGWIQPAVVRNKWPRLWSEPRDRKAWPCFPVGQYWDNLGVLSPVACPNGECPGIRSSTQQQPRTPLYWPTITGLPLNAGPNSWLFNNLRGGNATDGAAHPTR
jgi:hypothetical protein